jgi:TatD DNase family protein
MLIDIHRHSAHKGNADKVLRNLFHSETGEIEQTEFCSVGLHPWMVKKKNWQDHIELVKKSAKGEKVLAIGEAGLDKAIDTPIHIQREAFMAQIELAMEVEKPMIIHCVKAYDEIQSYRKNTHHKQPWIIHWYNASPQTGNDLMAKNCYLSFGVTLFKEQSKGFKTFMQIPIEKVFFETDDANVSINEVYQKAAELKNIELNTLKKIIKNNFNTCFNTSL